MPNETAFTLHNNIAVQTVDSPLRSDFREAVARLDGMTESDAHNVLWVVWCRHRPAKKADQSRELAARMDGMTEIELWHALSGIIQH